MDLIRHVVVFDAADVASESAFWAAMLDGRVVDEDPQFHCVIDSQGNWLVGVQRAPDHVPPDWPDGEPQQVHVDFHVTDPAAAHRRAIDLGARLLQDATDRNLTKDTACTPILLVTPSASGGVTRTMSNSPSSSSHTARPTDRGR